jgi:single-stranded DNA-binding protein
MLNSVLLAGFLEKDPLVITGRGGRMCEMLLRTGKRNGPETVQITIRAFGGPEGSLGEMFKKGDRVRVVGELRQASRKDGDGRLREWTYIKAQAVQKIGIDRKEAEEVE